MGQAVAVEDVDHAHLADGQHQPVGALPPGELVEVGVDLGSLAAKLDGLAQEEPLQLGVGRRLADLVGLARGKARRAQGVGEAEALVDLGVDPDLAPRPGMQARVEGGVESLAAVGRGVQAVGPAIGRGEGRMPLPDQGRLGVQGPQAVRIGPAGAAVVGERGGGGQQGQEQDRGEARGVRGDGHSILLRTARRPARLIADRIDRGLV